MPVYAVYRLLPPGDGEEAEVPLPVFGQAVEQGFVDAEADLALRQGLIQDFPAELRALAHRRVGHDPGDQVVAGGDDGHLGVEGGEGGVRRRVQFGLDAAQAFACRGADGLLKAAQLPVGLRLGQVLAGLLIQQDFGPWEGAGLLAGEVPQPPERVFRGELEFIVRLDRDRRLLWLELLLQELPVVLAVILLTAE